MYSAVETQFFDQLVSKFSGKRKLPEDLTLKGKKNMKRKDAKAKQNVLSDLEDESRRDTFDDTFSKHFDVELSSKDVDKLSGDTQHIKKSCLNWPEMGKVIIETPVINIERKYDFSPTYHPPTALSGDQLLKAGLKVSLANAISEPLTQLQTEHFEIYNKYYDLFYAESSLDKTEEIRFVYCLHLLNHMLKTRSRILNHNRKLAASALKKQNATKVLADKDRDQGLVRPKVLIVLPFRDSALQVVNIMIKQLYDSQADTKKKDSAIDNYKRFIEEYSGNEFSPSKLNKKPEDYKRIFKGNTDDHFRIGISLKKNSLKLYADFYTSDIIIASPLGIRTAVEGDKQNYDFLNSIEILVIDQADIFLAQNLENLYFLLDHLHLPLQTFHDTDFSRVRSWHLNGLARFYRQTLLLASQDLPEMRSLFNNKCHNYEGKIRTSNEIANGDINNVLVDTPQTFHFVSVSQLSSVFEERFQYFVREILPQYRNSCLTHCMIYVPSYFDFVRLRNYLKIEGISFVQICEYSKSEKVTRSRDIFFHGRSPFLLYSERYHFFRRSTIKGVRHLIMYQPPNWRNFYSELINMMGTVGDNATAKLGGSRSVKILYSKYDLLALSAILGRETAQKLINARKGINVFTIK